MAEDAFHDDKLSVSEDSEPDSEVAEDEEEKEDVLEKYRQETHTDTDKPLHINMHT
jgi:hypothetical protein